MEKIQNPKKYDLEDRTFRFAENCRDFIRRAPKTVSSIEDGKQLVRSSGSVAANYIEANEALSKKDFIMRVKICRKEAKESRLWLRLVRLEKDDKLEERRKELLQEATELMHIFGSIITKTTM